MDGERPLPIYSGNSRFPIAKAVLTRDSRKFNGDESFVSFPEGVTKEFDGQSPKL